VEIVDWNLVSDLMASLGSIASSRKDVYGNNLGGKNDFCDLICL